MRWLLTTVTVCFLLTFATSSNLEEVGRMGVSFFASLNPSLHKLHLQGAPEDCSALFNSTIDFLNANQCSTVFTLLQNLSIPNANITEPLETYCSSICQSEGRQRLNQTLETCRDYLTDAELTQAQRYWFASSVVCLRNANDTEYCLPDFRDLMVALSRATSLTFNLLSTYCTECTSVISNGWLTYDRSMEATYNATTIELYCEKRNTTFCTLQFAGIQNPIANVESSCQPCSFAMIRKKMFLEETRIKMYNLSHPTNEYIDLEKKAAFYDVICSRRWERNNLCFYDYPTNQKYSLDRTRTACAATLNTGMCDNACKTHFKDMANALSCCAGSQVRFLEANCDFKSFNGTPCTPTQDPYVFTNLSNICNTSIPVSCGLQRNNIRAILYFGNLSPTWCWADQAACTSVILRIIGYLTGLPTEDITLEFVMPPSTRRLLSDGVTVNVTVITDSGAVDSTVFSLGTTIPESLFINNSQRADLTQPIDIVIVQYNMTQTIDPRDPGAPGYKEDVGSANTNSHVIASYLIALFMVFVTLF